MAQEAAHTMLDVYKNGTVPVPCHQVAPQRLWGLDPLAHVHMKLYITDILHMLQVDGHPGLFQYGSHLVTKVDIVGIVVSVHHKQKFSKYAVDDGTGVVSCMCWKSSSSDDDLEFRMSVSDHLGPELGSKQFSQHSTRDNREDFIHESAYELGDLVHIRGRVRVFNGQREVNVYHHALLTDPMAEVARMYELPQLYRNYYDKPVVYPQKVSQKLGSGEGDGSRLEELGHEQKVLEVIQEHLAQSTCCDLTTEEVIKWPEMETVTSDLKLLPDVIQKLVNSSLEKLAAQGALYCDSQSHGNYKVVIRSKELHEAVKGVLRRDCHKPQYADQGCHYLHILSELRHQAAFARLEKNSLLRCLDVLESNSDIISTTDSHFVCMDDL